MHWRHVSPSSVHRISLLFLWAASAAQHTAAAAAGTSRMIVSPAARWSSRPSSLVPRRRGWAARAGWTVVALEGGEEEARSMIRCPKIVQASEGGGPRVVRDGALRPGHRIKRCAAAPQSPRPGMALVAGAGAGLRQRAIVPWPPAGRRGLSHSTRWHNPPSTSSRAVGECCVNASQGPPKDGCDAS